MTKTALENLKIRSQERIAEEDRKLKASEGKKEREHRSMENEKNRDLQRREGRKSRIASYIGGALGAGAKLGAAAINDPSWYKNYFKELSEFVNVPTFDRLGSNTLHGLYAYNDGKIPTSLYEGGAVPGVMSIYWQPTVGSQNQTLGITDAALMSNAINQSLARFKEKVLALNSRSSVTWEPADLGYNVFCSSDIMTLILAMGRAIKIYRTYHARNRYLAKALVEASGFNYSDMASNYANYRKAYKLYSTRFNKSVVAPIDLSIYSRRAFLASEVFIDSDNPSNPRQMYVYRQNLLFTLSNDATYCEASVCPDWTFSTITTQLDLMLGRITENYDFIEMYQDLRHAFGDRLVQLPEDIDLEEIRFNSEKLNRMQIHNLKSLPLIYTPSAVGPTTNVSGWGLHQNSSGYIYQGSTTSTGGRYQVYNIGTLTATGEQGLEFAMSRFYEESFLYNSDSEVVSGDEILDITRMNVAGQWYKDSQSGEHRFQVDYCGTEVVQLLRVHLYDAAGTQHIVYANTVTITTDTTITGYDELIRLAAYASSFDWQPIMHLVRLEAANSSVGWNTLMDGYHSFVIGLDDLDAINRACVMSELFVPSSNFAR